MIEVKQNDHPGQDKDVIRPNEPVIFKLSKPIKTHREGEISELTLRPVGAGSFIRHGSPYAVSGEQIIPDWKATFGFLYDMTGHDAGVLGAVPMCDTMPLFYKLVGMLTARPQNG